MTAGLLFFGFFWAIFILPSHLFSSPESACPPQSPSPITRAQHLNDLRAQKEKIKLPSWADYQECFKSWRNKLESSPSASQPSAAPYNDLTLEIRTHAQMMIQALQLDRHAKYIAKSIVLPGSLLILPSQSPEVDKFMKKHWPTPSLTNMHALEKAFQHLLRKLDPGMPHVPPMEDGPAQDEGVDLSSSLDSTLSLS
ncbi:MAG: hypothetical protein ACK5PQ_05150 [Alphaproteobacteria bacterium]